MVEALRTPMVNDTDIDISDVGFDTKSIEVGIPKRPSRSATHHHGFTSTKQTARDLDLTHSYVRRLCRTGRIKGAKKVGDTWMIPSPVVVLDPCKACRGSGREPTLGMQYLCEVCKGTGEMSRESRKIDEPSPAPIS